MLAVAPCPCSRVSMTHHHKTARYLSLASEPLSRNRFLADASWPAKLRLRQL